MQRQEEVGERERKRVGEQEVQIVGEVQVEQTGLQGRHSAIPAS
jgi:hypothetical protein